MWELDLYKGVRTKHNESRVDRETEVSLASTCGFKHTGRGPRATHHTLMQWRRRNPGREATILTMSLKCRNVELWTTREVIEVNVARKSGKRG